MINGNKQIYECMTPMEEYNTWGDIWMQSGNIRVFDTTCRLVTPRNCQSNLAENKIVIDRKSYEAKEAWEAINDFIDFTLNPQRFEQLAYKVDVLMGVSCAYKQVYTLHRVQWGKLICFIFDFGREIKFAWICTSNALVMWMLNYVHGKERRWNMGLW